MRAKAFLRLGGPKKGHFDQKGAFFERDLEFWFSCAAAKSGAYRRDFSGVQDLDCQASQNRACKSHIKRPSYASARNVWYNENARLH